ncbi:L-histidine N(alpha)-methyltransferase [Gilvimarinus chinensis]|uniref:L-histidine N(alpha)-methyltransferase n=1 Tax=Gilvimarinus chinensis TaxID=396005 RepID=UPI000366DD0A|nr:L-histidine N(alpha)-methyltransferase [Gilvimarinus chinensis]
MSQTHAIANDLHTDNEFLSDVLNGLNSSPKTLPPKYFYDAKGSQYFDDICSLPDYYLYQTELDLLPIVAQDLAKHIKQQDESGLEIVEFGAGSLRKVGMLLRAIPQINHFTAIDISHEHLISACRTLESQYRELSITPCVHDFTKPLKLCSTARTRIGFFPGSTIGNLNHREAEEFLNNAALTLGKHSYLLIGVDTKKSESVLQRAYNDTKGVTAKFNKNILHRINRELDANFSLESFGHQAFYNAEHGRVEMHLRSLKSQTVFISGEPIEFTRGESIHTENSYKYHPPEFNQLAKRSGWSTEKLWLAPQDQFAIYLLKHRD